MTIILFTLITLMANTTLHEFHLSKCQIEYSQEDRALQVSLYLYIDDLEEALRQKGKDQLYICTKKEAPKAEQYISEYIKEHFLLQVNGQLRDFEFIGKEPAEDLIALWCYFEFPDIGEIKKLNIENKLLMEIFDDQKNIVSMIAPDNQQAYFLFEKGKYSETLTF